MLMRQMRQNTKIIMLVTALAFVALMVFEWGMDMSGQTAGGDLGRVGGTSVSVQEYQETYRTLYNQVQETQDRPISAAQDREIEDMAWEEVVNRILIRQELDRRGIGVSDEEIQQAALYAPPPEFRADPSFQDEDGQFDIARYQQFLQQAAQDPQFMRQLEMYYRDVLPQEKLARQLAAGIHVSDRELWERWKDEHESVAASFLAVDPDAWIDDGAVDVSDAEVESYYEENLEEFSVPERAQVRYTHLDVGPAGDQDAREIAEEARQAILDGEDFAAVAARESADPGTADQGGELEPFGRGDMDPALEDAAFSMEPGEISEPIRTTQGYHILEVLERDELQVEESRHVLIPVEQTGADAIQMLMRADSLETMAADRSLEEAAEHFELEVAEGSITEDFPILTGVGPADEAADWLFEEGEGAPGVVSPLFETDDTFYVVEVLQQWPSGYQELSEVRSQIEATLRADRKRELVREEAADWVAQLRAGDATLEDLAADLGLEIETAGPFTRSEFVPGLGESSAAIGSAFGTSEGGITGPVDAQDRVVVLRVDERDEPDREEWEAQKETQRVAVQAEIEQTRMEQWLEGLRESTRINDGREEYFRAAEEQEDQPQIPMAF